MQMGMRRWEVVRTHKNVRSISTLGTIKRRVEASNRAFMLRMPPWISWRLKRATSWSTRQGGLIIWEASLIALRFGVVKSESNPNLATTCRCHSMSATIPILGRCFKEASCSPCHSIASHRWGNLERSPTVKSTNLLIAWWARSHSIPTAAGSRISKIQSVLHPANTLWKKFLHFGAAWKFPRFDELGTSYMNAIGVRGRFLQ